MSRDRNNQQQSEQRKKRIPVGKRKLSMTVDPSLVPEDSIGRWVNDVGGQLQRFLDGGYVFVHNNKRGVNSKVGDDVNDGNTDLGSRISKVVDKTARTNSDPVRAYLMCIKKEWYDEDQKAKTAGVEKIDSQIRTGLKDIEEDRGSFDAKIKYTA